MQELDSFSAHLERHAALCARWGKPQMMNAAAALSLMGLAPDGATPDDVVAFRYASVEAAEAFAASNLENYGYRSLGIKVTDAGVIGVTRIIPRGG